MGLTLQCARCHDHKFDPISQRDYYRLFAFFNNIPDPPVAYASKKLVRVGEPTIALRNYADESELAALLAAKAELKAALPAKDAGKPEPTKAEAEAQAGRGTDRGDRRADDPRDGDGRPRHAAAGPRT
jgi:hypothetical protein